MAKILVIDDDRGIRHLLDALLRHKGYHVLLADNGQTGLELFRQERPYVIVLDLKMPDMDGLTLLSHVRSLNIHQPVIIYSGAWTSNDPIVTCVGFEARSMAWEPEVVEKPTQRRVEPLGDTSGTGLMKREALSRMLAAGSSLRAKTASPANPHAGLRFNFSWLRSFPSALLKHSGWFLKDSSIAMRYPISGTEQFANALYVSYDSLGDAHDQQIHFLAAHSLYSNSLSPWYDHQPRPRRNLAGGIFRIHRALRANSTHCCPLFDRRPSLCHRKKWAH